MNCRFLLLPALAVSVGLTSCDTMESQNNQAARMAMVAAIPTEAPGNYFIGRRYYKVDYKFWGFVRRPGEPWSTAKMVMLNEQSKLAPDREADKVGSDNNYEYKLTGEFSGQTVYEPSSNSFYPEFVLKGSELRSATPASIYRTPGALDPQRRVIVTPY